MSDPASLCAQTGLTRRSRRSRPSKPVFASQPRAASSPTQSSQRRSRSSSSSRRSMGSPGGRIHWSQSPPASSSTCELSRLNLTGERRSRRRRRQRLKPRLMKKLRRPRKATVSYRPRRALASCLAWRPSPRCTDRLKRKRARRPRIRSARSRRDGPSPTTGAKATLT